MIRNDQSTTATGGRSSAGKSFRLGIWPSQLWVRMRLARWGMVTAKRFVSASWSGSANSTMGTPSPGWFSQCPSMAATFTGWCSRVFRPWKSPTTACSGATINNIHSAIENMVRMAGLSRPRSRSQAAEAPTKSALDRKAAIAMCTSR